MLERFTAYLQVEKRYSTHTVLAYQNDVKQFLTFIDINELNEIKEVEAKLIRAWIVDLIDHKNENKSVNRKLSSLRTFFRWLKKEDLINVNPMVKINGPKNIKRLPSFVKESDLISDKLDLVFNKDFNGIRDRLIFEFFYQTGIRLIELVELKNEDVQKEFIKVLGKRNKERLIPIAPSLSNQISQYRLFLKQLNFDSNYFFLLNNGNKVYPKFVYRRINYYLSGVTNLDKCSPHILRHTFATHMLNNGAGLETLKDLLGHANLSATQIYTHNSFSKLTNIYSQAHPRGLKND
jgi:integrase/recombinase XerC